MIHDYQASRFADFLLQGPAAIGKSLGWEGLIAWDTMKINIADQANKL